MTTDFWTRVLAEYGANDSDDEWALCCASPTFRAAFHADVTCDELHTLAGQFLANTDAGQHFQRGHVYLFVLRWRPDDTDYNARCAQQRAVRRDFLLWAADNDRDDNTSAVRPASQY
jgi:hypothetical protein